MDRRTDIWALGCVIYEALTGKQAFAGDNISDTIAAVIRGEPDWSALPPDTPRRVRMLLDRCLRKDPRQRLHDAADVRIEIDDLSAGGEAVVTLPSKTTANRFLPMAIGLAAGLVIASTFWWLRARSSDKGPEPQHLSVSLASDAIPTGGRTESPFAISPDGRRIVYTVVRAGKSQLFLSGDSRGRGQAD